MPIIHWKPFQELEEMFERPVFGQELACDVSEDENTVYVKMNVPGIDADKINIDVEDHHLRVSAEREEKKEETHKNYYRKEIRYGEFERVVDLPCPVDETKVTAEVKDGILNITLPKKKGKTTSKVKVTKV
jgi:HSP20 family protein